jgi:hypothetical protein
MSQPTSAADSPPPFALRRHACPLARLFGVERAVVRDGQLIVDGRHYPVVDGVVIVTGDDVERSLKHEVVESFGAGWQAFPELSITVALSYDLWPSALTGFGDHAWRVLRSRMCWTCGPRRYTR